MLRIPGLIKHCAERQRWFARTKKGEVLVQFDCVGLEDAHGTQLGAGWHSFPAAHFEIDEDEI